MQEQYPVIFFDGICGLCNRFVDFLLMLDKNELYRFSPLQSEYAAKALPKEILARGEGEFKSIVLFVNGKIYQRSDAVLRILSCLGGFWRLTCLLRIFPSFLRDAIYSLVAVNRYNWFGKKESCRIPTPAERKRFLL